LSKWKIENWKLKKFFSIYSPLKSFIFILNRSMTPAIWILTGFTFWFQRYTPSNGIPLYLYPILGNIQDVHVKSAETLEPFHFLKVYELYSISWKEPEQPIFLNILKPHWMSKYREYRTRAVLSMTILSAITFSGPRRALSLYLYRESNTISVTFIEYWHINGYSSIGVAWSISVNQYISPFEVNYSRSYRSGLTQMRINDQSEIRIIGQNFLTNWGASVGWTVVPNHFKRKLFLT